jgi:hypothetical protein
VAATLRIFGAHAGLGSYEDVAALAAALTGSYALAANPGGLGVGTGSPDTTVSAATTPTSVGVPPGGGSSLGGGGDAVGTGGTLLLGSPGAMFFPGYPSDPLYGMPPAAGPFSATAFLCGLSPRPISVAAADSALAAALESTKTEAAAARSACVWLPSPGSTSTPRLTHLLAESLRRSASSTPLRGSESPPLSSLRLLLCPH